MVWFFAVLLAAAYMAGGVWFLRQTGFFGELRRMPGRELAGEIFAMSLCALLWLPILLLTLFGPRAEDVSLDWPDEL